MPTDWLESLIYVLVPLLAALVKQSGWSGQRNALVAIGVYLAVAIAGTLIGGEPLTLETIVPRFTAATVLGTVAYQLFWRNVGEQQIEEATSFVR